VKKSVKPPLELPTAPVATPGDSLVGRILHCRSGVTMTQNTFCVILQEKPKTVLLAELSTEKKEDQPDSGYERPMLQDGALAACAVEEIFRVTKPRLEGPKQTTLIALIRMDQKFFDPHEVNQAFWLWQHHQREVGKDAVIVRIFRANKVLEDDGAIVFRHFRKRFHLWNGKDKYYNHND
jgi:hypothetical protein